MNLRLIIQTKFFKQSEEKAYQFDIFKFSQAKDRNEVYAIFQGEHARRFYGDGLLDISLDGPVLLGDFTIKTSGESHSIVTMIRDSVTWVINSLWFIKDNSCNLINTAYIIDGHLTYLIETHEYNSKANSEFEDTEFTLEEWNRAIELFHIYRRIGLLKYKGDLPKFKIEERDVSGFVFRKNDGSYIDYNEYNRIERAFMFILQARKSVFLPAKVSFYVLALECLFSANDMGEIKYKIGLRVASFLGGDRKEKKENFDFVQLTYKVRSKYLHGQPLDKKTKRNENLLEISEKIDSLLRDIMLRVLRGPEPFLEENQDKLSEWFDELTFQ